MKKTLALILALTMAISVFVVSPIADATSNGVIVFDFENNVKPDTYSDRGVISTDKAAHGTHSYKANANEDTPFLLGELSAGKTYAVDLYVYPEGTQNSVIRTIVGTGWPRNGAYDKDQVTVWGSQGNKWSHVSFTYTMPSEDQVYTSVGSGPCAGKTYTNALWLRLNNAIPVYVDDVRVTEVTSDTVMMTYLDTYDTFNNDYARTFTVAAKKGDNITFEPLKREGYEFAGWYTGANGTGTKVTVYPNTNSTVYAKWVKETTPINAFFDFENNIKPDTYSDRGVISTDKAAHGTHSYKANANEDTPFLLGELNAGKTYAVDLYVYPEGTQNSVIRTIVGTGWPRNGAYDKDQVTVWGSQGNKWSHVSFTYTMPSEDQVYTSGGTGPCSGKTYTNALWLRLNNTIPVYVDDVRVTEVTSDTVMMTYLDTYDTFNNDYARTFTVAGKKGETINFAPLNRDGYTFDGWYTGANGTGTKVTAYPTTDTVVYANWAENVPDYTIYSKDGKNYCKDKTGTDVYGLYNIDGKYYYFLKDDYHDGSQYFKKVRVAGKTYDLSNGGYAVAPEGWNGTKYVLNGRYASGLTNIGGKNYYFDDNNNLVSGRVTVGTKEYYFVNAQYGSYGYTGKVKLGKTVYTAVDGLLIMADGWYSDENGKYYIKDGKKAVGITEIDGVNYYFDIHGTQQTGFITHDGYFYYFLSSNNGAQYFKKVSYHGKIYNFKDGKIKADVLNLSDIELMNKICLEGRCDITKDGTTLDFSGSALKFKTNCTGKVSVKLTVKTQNDPKIYFSLFVDGVKSANRIELTTGETEITLADNLGEGIHEIEFVRSCEARAGNVTATVLNLENGEIVETEKSDTLIEFIGDSITCGNGNLQRSVPSGEDTGAAKYQDVTLAYSYLVPKSLGYDYRIVSYSGMGINANPWGGTLPSLGDFYSKQSYCRNAAKGYDFENSRKADIACINIGTNDCYSSVVADPTPEQYVSLVKKLYGKETKIVLIYGVMTSGFGTAVTVAAETLKSEGYDCSVLRLSEFHEGLNGHPYYTNHAVLTNEIIAFLNK